MKRVILIGVGVLAVLVVAILAAPSLIDWNRFKPDIARAVADATGRELRIEGDLDISLLPAIEFSAAGIHLANPPGFSAPDLATIEAVSGRVAILPLLRRQVVVEQFVVEKPEVALEVNPSGEANWLFEPAEPAADEGDAGGGGLPIGDLRLDDVRVTDGAFSYHDAPGGQDLVGRDLNVTASLPAIDGPLAVAGTWTLNDEPVTLDASVAPFEALVSDAAGQIRLKLDTKHLQAQLDAGVQVQPLVGLDGDASIDVPSVGSLAAWLDVPYDQDPGPLHLTARFQSDGPVVALEEATLEGDQLSARASASIDTSGDATKIVANIESGVLDIDRYLPPMPDDRGRAGPHRAGRETAAPLEAVPDTPLDLSALRKLIADISVSIDGIRLAGYAIGPIRLEATAEDGVLVGDLQQVGLYGGTIGGSLRLDASADTLAAQTEIDVANVDVGALARVAAGDAPPVAGIASGQLSVSTAGSTARELAQSTVGKLAADLQFEGEQGPVGQLTDLSLAVERPAVDAQIELAGRAVYNQEGITFVVVTDPVLAALLGADPIAIRAEIDSSLLTASYDGRVVQAPVVSLDGTFDAKITSVGRLASWLGQPLPEGQADPGALEAHAVLESDGATGKIDEAYLRGEGLSLEATGDFDASGDVTRFNLALNGGVLDLDRYLPAGDEAAAPDAEQDGAAGAGGDPLAALSDQPIDASPLRQYAGEIEVSLQGIKATGVEVGAVDLRATLDNGRLEVALDKVDVADGIITANASVDGSGETLGITATISVDQLQTPRFDEALRGTGATLQGVASAEVELSSRGNSPRALVTGATGKLKLDLPGTVLDQGPIASISNIDASVELPGVDANPKIETTADLQTRESQKTVPFVLSGQLGPLSKLLEGQEAPLELAAKIGEVELHVDGRIAGLDSTPRPDLAIRLEGPQLSDLGVLTGGELPAVGPLSVAATVSTDDGTYRVADLTAQLGQSDLIGNVSLELGGERPKLTADLSSRLIDVPELMPPQEEGSAPQPQSTEDTGRIIPDDPLPLDALKALDADVTLSIAQLRTHTAADVDNLNARITLADGQLSVAPVDGETAGGSFELQLTLDGAAQPAALGIDLQADQLLMGTFGELLQRSGASVGKLDASIELKGQGNTPHQIASSLAGRANLIGAGGAVDSAVLQLLAVGIGSIFDPIFSDQGNSDLNCFIVSFDFEDGLGTSRAMLIDFPSMSIAGGGTIDLKDETLDLSFATESKKASLVSLAVPFNVGGSLASPTVTPNVAGTAFEAVKAFGIYVNPLVAVSVLAAGQVVDAVSENPCVVAIEQAEGAEPAEGASPGVASGAESVVKGIGEGLKGLFGGGKN